MFCTDLAKRLPVSCTPRHLLCTGCQDNQGHTGSLHTFQTLCTLPSLHRFPTPHLCIVGFLSHRLCYRWEDTLGLILASTAYTCCRHRPRGFGRGSPRSSSTQHIPLPRCTFCQWDSLCLYHRHTCCPGYTSLWDSSHSDSGCLSNKVRTFPEKNCCPKDISRDNSHTLGWKRPPLHRNPQPEWPGCLWRGGCSMKI